MGFTFSLSCLASNRNNSWHLDETYLEFNHVTFEKISPTKYEYHQQKRTLIATVKQSASLFFYPFKEKKILKNCQLDWRIRKGHFPKMTPEMATTKEGDDAPLRIGLLLYGKPNYWPFFVPHWIEKTKSLLRYPSDKILYLTFGLPIRDGHRWANPYSDSIESISIGCQPKKNGWQHCSYQPKGKIEMVGLWILADGDNLKSEFEIEMRNVSIDFTP